uniref:Acetyltransferase n=1 Tax=Oryza punctata TaxID=4537 RepID=A0A0E0LQJ1_ORYPU
MGSNDDHHSVALAVDRVRVLSRRLVPPSSSSGHAPPCDDEDIHLTPWDLRLLTIDYIQKGVLLPKPPVAGDRLADELASSLARALVRFYPFAGRLVAEERADGTVTVTLRCNGEGAEFVHAAAPGVAVSDVVSSLYTPSEVWSFYSYNLVLGADAAIESRPVLSVQVTELADGVFIGMSLNHSVGDGTTFWEFMNAWSEINRRAGCAVSDDQIREISTSAPVFRRWFVETSPVPIPMPVGKLQHIVRRFERTEVQECFFTFSAPSARKLKARANEEMAGTATATISSLQAVLAHLWRAVCRARRLPAAQVTFYTVMIGCRGRVNGIPSGYVGNALSFGKVEATAGEIEEKGLGWTAWLLNRAVASFDEAAMRESLERWVREPDFTYMSNLQSAAGVALVTGSSPRFDVFGNDFGWGKPVAVRSGAGNKIDGKATVFEGPEKGGSMSLEVCIAPDALRRLVADEEFMDAVTVPSSETETVHLTPWDIQMITVDYIQNGVLLPKPPTGGELLVEHLASSFARALGRFYPFAGRLAVEESEGKGRSRGAREAITVLLRCTGEGAELVHAVAPDVTVADVAASLYVPRVVWSFFPLDGMVGADAVSAARPVLAAQVTELADSVFVAMSLNHGVADGTTFWHLFNTWSEISRSGGGNVDEAEISTMPPVLDRWFPDACAVPVTLPFAKLEHIVRRFECPPVDECFFHFSPESVKHLKATANAEVAGEATATISSLQALLAHVWRSVSRARRLPPEQETTYTVLVGCRGRVKHIPQAYAGNAVVRATARATAGEIAGRGLGWTAWLLNRAVASLDEEALVRSASSWPREPRFAYLAGWWHPAAMVTGNSPRFDVFGNDFGWGRPVGVRSGGANKVDGRATVYEGRGGGGGAMAMEVCLAPETLARVVADAEFLGRRDVVGLPCSLG